MGQVARIAVLKTQEVETIKHIVCDTVGGKVEGRPTSNINYLQRLRELVAKEETLAAHDRANELALNMMDEAIHGQAETPSPKGCN